MTLESLLDFQRWGGGEPTAVGEGYSCTYKGRYYSVLFTRAGMFRGNHVHPHRQHTLLLDGRGKYVFRGEDGKETVHRLSVGRILDVEAGVPHIFLPESDCLTVEWWEGPFVAEEFDFPEYTREIRRRMVAFDRESAELKSKI